MHPSLAVVGAFLGAITGFGTRPPQNAGAPPATSASGPAPSLDLD
jgi:hypothetical protein